MYIRWNLGGIYSWGRDETSQIIILFEGVETRKKKKESTVHFYVSTDLKQIHLSTFPLSQEKKIYTPIIFRATQYYVEYFIIIIK